MEEGAFNNGWTGNDPHRVGAPSVYGKGKMRNDARHRAAKPIPAPQQICSRPVVMSHLRRFTPSWPASRKDGHERAVSKRTEPMVRGHFRPYPWVRRKGVGPACEHLFSP